MTDPNCPCDLDPCNPPPAVVNDLPMSQIVTGSTCCNLDIFDNIWVEGEVNPPSQPGVCMLDQLTAEQIKGILRVNPRSRVDLLRVSSIPAILKLWEETRLLPLEEEHDVLQHSWNSDAPAFYSHKIGQPR